MTATFSIQQKAASIQYSMFKEVDSSYLERDCKKRTKALPRVFFYKDKLVKNPKDSS